MNVTSAAAASLALAALAATGAAQARDFGAEPHRARGVLPAPSGTIHLSPDAFGAGRAAARHWRHRWLAGGHRRHRYGPLYGYQGGAYGQLWRGGYNVAGSEVFWNRNVEFYGEGNDTGAMLGLGVGANRGSARRNFDGYRTSDAGASWRRNAAYHASVTPGLVTTGWGTADSATTGGSYPPPSSRRAASDPVRVVYGDSGNWSGTRGLTYGSAPTGGLGYYNSGSPGGLGYYGSSSSAGPGGTPGGLAIYSSGSYGPGPHVIRLGDRQADWAGARVASGPRIIHLHGEDEGAED